MLHTVRPINKSFCLQMLCEENYAKLLRLIPSIEKRDLNSTAIHSNVLATGPFTFTVYLQQANSNKENSTPRFKCRIYLDTKSVEVIDIDGQVQLQTTSPKDILNNKWAMNYLFEKWLTFQFNLHRVEHSHQQAANA